MHDKTKNIFLLLIICLGIISMFFIPSIKQDLSYHSFADKRFIFNTPNFWNVFSNTPFIITGIVGMGITFIKKQKGVVVPFYKNSLWFFGGIFLIGLGSGYYHLNPSNSSLVWDRLPMTISFMAFFSIIIADFVCKKSGERLLIPLILIGILSILYWQMTEEKGNGDLRFYALVQFLPMLMIPIIIIIYKENIIGKKQYWGILIFYLLAKLGEGMDIEIYNKLKIISGHTLKHFFAALAPILFIVALNKKKNNSKNL